MIPLPSGSESVVTPNYLKSPLKVLLFDCRDSFTYNLAHLIGEILSPADRLEVVSSRSLNLRTISQFNRLILSPGPGLPWETENLYALIKLTEGSIPTLGVCLGHQALANYFGADLFNLKRVCHGLQSKIKIVDQKYLFYGLPEVIEGGRYHSWVVEKKNFPRQLQITAQDEQGQIMGFRHRCLDIQGVQFHPESILTPAGPKILTNFLFGQRR
jgi:anthranilate synthase component 2